MSFPHDHDPSPALGADHGSDDPWTSDADTAPAPDVPAGSDDPIAPPPFPPGASSGPVEAPRPTWTASQPSTPAPAAPAADRPTSTSSPSSATTSATTAAPSRGWPAPPPPPAPPEPPRRPGDPSPEPSRRSPRWVPVLVILAALALAGGGALAGWAIAERGDDTTTPAEQTPSAPPATVQTGDGGEAGIVPSDVAEPVAAVADAVAPSVVQIETNFGLGSGVVMDDQGHVLTAAHVIEGAVFVRVRFPDGTIVEADVIGTHPPTDVGVIAVGPRDDLVPAVLGIDADVSVGQLAVAVGSPFGLDQTVTSGIVSALDRPIETEGTYLVGMIQTDASINPGNSGGALADRHGRVIGINDAIRTQGGGNEGVGFAIPIDLAASIAERLVAGEEIRSGFLGVSVGPVTEGRAGALVQEVTPGTPADDAGIEVGDLIVSVDGQPVRGVRDLRASILAIDPGTPVAVTVVRDDQEVDLEVVLTVSEL